MRPSGSEWRLISTKSGNHADGGPSGGGAPRTWPARAAPDAVRRVPAAARDGFGARSELAATTAARVAAESRGAHAPSGVANGSRGRRWAAAKLAAGAGGKGSGASSHRGEAPVAMRAAYASTSRSSQDGTDLAVVAVHSRRISCFALP